MKAVTFSEYGGPEVLHVADVDEPHAGSGQVRIAVRAAGVNPIDWKARSGTLREFMPVSFPAIDGREAAGVVDEAGPGRPAWRPATRCSALLSGARQPSRRCWTTSPASPPACRGSRQPACPSAAETSVRVFNVLGGVGEGQTL